MRSKDNGDPQVCVNNLLSIIRGEVAYDRIRGIGSEPIDRPTGEAIADIEQDARWVINTYEPRAEVNRIDVVQDDASMGSFKINAEVQ